MTPKERAAMQQALEDLKKLYNSFVGYVATYEADKCFENAKQSITALQEALDHSGEANEMVQESVLLAKGFSEWNLDAETGKFLADMITAGDEPIEVTLRLGFIRDLDGSVQYGLLANETEYPEEGAVLLLELNPINAAPQSVSQEPVATDSAKKDAVFEASIQFIKTLTGMEPPPIEVAPPEVFAPFREFTEKVCKIFSEPPKAEREQPVSQEPVAWMQKGTIEWIKQPRNERNQTQVIVTGVNVFDGQIPVYAAPVRTKDLTDDEIMKINVDTASIVPTCDRQFHFARAVIAAYKEKNK